MDFSRAGSEKVLAKITRKTEETNADRIIEIPVADIRENPDNEHVFSMDDIKILAESIRDEGFIGAIEVVALPGGGYEIVAGHRRYRAARQVGLTSIPCIISRTTDARARARRLITSNIANRKMTMLDWGRAAEYYMLNVSEEGRVSSESKKECMERFNMTAATLSRCLALTKLSERLQQIAAKDGFAVSALATVSRSLSEEEQSTLADWIEAYVAENSTDDTPDYSVLSRNEILKKIEQMKKPEQIRRSSVPAEPESKKSEFNDLDEPDDEPDSVPEYSLSEGHREAIKLKNRLDEESDQNEESYVGCRQVKGFNEYIKSLKGVKLSKQQKDDLTELRDLLNELIS